MVKQQCANGGFASCADCHLKYEDFPADMLIQNGLWVRISPRHDLSGLLCPNCVCRRLIGLGMTRVLVTVDVSELITAELSDAEGEKGEKK